jgi:hypothetical protein
MLSAYAQETTESTIPAPPGAQTASFESLIRVVKDQNTQIEALQKDLAEAKAQIPAMLEYQYDRLLALLLFWSLGWTALSRLLGRFWEYAIDQRFRRATEDQRARVLRELKDIRARVEGLDALLRKVSVEVKDIVPPTLPQETQKKRSVFDWILRRKKE